MANATEAAGRRHHKYSETVKPSWPGPEASAAPYMQTTFAQETTFSNIATSFADLETLDQSFESRIQTFATEIQNSVTKMRNLTQLISGQLEVRAL